MSGFDHGFGYGFGSGDGFGDGSGDGSGYGYGSGDGSGSGFGFGSGSGSGGGDGIKIGRCGDHDIELHPDFGILTIGCEAHEIDYWRANWRAIADKHKQQIADNFVEEIERKMK